MLKSIVLTHELSKHTLYYRETEIELKNIADIRSKLQLLTYQFNRKLHWFFWGFIYLHFEFKNYLNFLPIEESIIN